MPHHTLQAQGPRSSVLINIERENPTTAAHDPAKPGGGCNGEAQYVVIRGKHKLIVGGGGQPNTWYRQWLRHHFRAGPLAAPSLSRHYPSQTTIGHRPPTTTGRSI